jgi:iron complex transport system substrate-binding protein
MRLMLRSLFIIIPLLFAVTSAAADGPKRIISLAPNVTEILFALGLHERIVAVTSFCDYPEEAKKKSKIGGMSNPSLEEVVSLKPDIVIMTTDGNAKDFADRLRSFRIPTYVFRARVLSDLPHGIRAMGAALDVRDKADLLAREIESSLVRLSQSVPHVSRREKVLFIIWPEPLIVAGPGTAINDAITLLGHHNVAAESKSPYPKFSIEEILLRAPDVIFIGKGHADMQDMSKGLLKKLSKVPAVANRRVFFVSDNLYRLGPRVIRGIEEMAACLQ